MLSSLPSYTSTAVSPNVERVSTTVEPQRAKVGAGCARKSQSFSRRVFAHGMPKDASLASETRTKQKEQVNVIKTEQNIDRVNAIFEAESKHVHKLQALLASRQREMARIALERFSAITIQSSFRRFSAQKLLFLLQQGTFVSIFVQYQLAYRRRKRAAIIIQCWTRALFAIKLYRITVKLNQVTRSIQRVCRRFLNKRRAIVAFQVARARRDVLAHVIPFATTRAARKIRAHFAVNGPETLEDQQARIITRLFRRIVSANRAAFIKGPFGRIAFFYILRGNYKSASGVRDVAIAEYLLDSFKVQLSAAAAQAEAAEKAAITAAAAAADSAFAAAELAQDEQVNLAFPLTTVVEESDELLQQQQDDDTVELKSVPIPKELKRFLVNGLVTMSNVWELVKQMACAARCDLSLLDECLHMCSCTSSAVITTSTTLKRVFVDEYIRSQSKSVKVEKKVEKKRGNKGTNKAAAAAGGGKHNPSRSVLSSSSNSKGKKIASSSTSSSSIINNNSKATLNAAAAKAPSSSSTSTTTIIAQKQGTTTLVAASKTPKATAINNVTTASAAIVASPPESIPLTFAAVNLVAAAVVVEVARGDDLMGESSTEVAVGSKEGETREAEANSTSTSSTGAIQIQIVDRQKTLGKALFSSSIPSALIDRPLANVGVSITSSHKEDEKASDWRQVEEVSCSKLPQDLVPSAPPPVEEGGKHKSLNQHRSVKLAATSTSAV